MLFSPANRFRPARQALSVQAPMFRGLIAQGLGLILLLLTAGLGAGSGLDGLSLGPSRAQAQMAPVPSTPNPSLEKLTIISNSAGTTKENVFMVEVMRTPYERARGLMFRRYLPADRGMLFEFGTEAPVSMWMKDTFIPLDMIFIKKDGTINAMVLNTEPHSLRTISSGDSIWSVLEVNAGTVQRLGLRPGDQVVHPLFSGKK